MEQAKQELIRRSHWFCPMGDEVKDKMVGIAALAVVFRRRTAIRWENEDIDYVIPKEGSNLWFDAMVIPKTSQNKEAPRSLSTFN